GALAGLRRLFLFLAGQAFAAKSLDDRPPDNRPLSLLTHGLALFRIAPERMSALAESLDEAAKCARDGGYLWLSFQFRWLADSADPGGAVRGTDRWPPLAKLFREDEEWRRGLGALAEIALRPDSKEAGRRKRLVWLMSFPAHPAHPFAPMEIQPIEQSLAADGSWSKGRNISLRRIFRRYPDLPFASDQDRQVFSAIRTDADPFSSNDIFFFDIPAAMLLLVGHPLVFRADSAGVKVEVAAGAFELAVAERDGGCEISLEPALSEFPPAGTKWKPESADSWLDRLPGAAARLETPTRIRVFRLGERERRLAGILGDGLSVPARGRAEAIRTLELLSGRVRLQSDLPELAGEGEMVEADSLPCFHVLPQNPGLRVEIWSHPFGADGPACRPGRGGRVLAGTAGERQLRTVRDLAAEKEGAEAAAAACPSLSDFADGEFSWRLDDPGAGLAFLSEAEELGDRARLVWPRGGRLRVRNCRGLGGLSLRVRSAAGWLEIDGDLKVDEDLVVDMDRLIAACRHSAGRFVEIGEGEYLALSEELRRQLSDLVASGEAHHGGFRISDLAGGLLEEMEKSGAGLDADAEWRRRLERRRSLARFTPDPPEGFAGKLRDYQLDGFRWLARLAEWGAGACLADDMGLGKTIQALAIMAYRLGLGPALVVAPTSVCHNWLSETRRFAPDLRMAPLRSTDRSGQLAGLGPGDAIIASYSLLHQEKELLSGVKWSTVVLDEAQAIKNFATRRSRAAMSLDAGFRLITTGTPVENRLGELWNLFHFINPNLLGSSRRFQERFAFPIERLKDREAGERLRRIIRPFVLRRTKPQVLASLPPKTEITLSVELGERELAFYESLRRSALERIGEDGNAKRKSMTILAEITRLRRACCSPELIPGGEQVPSAKQEQFKATLTELVENRHKALVFSQFVDHLSIIRRHLDEVGYSYQYLDGSTPPALRKKAVEDFHAGRGDVFLLSLKAGGLGLNLTAADYVIHMDPWWNPAVEDQATDRAFRIGQNKNVLVHKCVT
ncbi:MAG: DEAD/DEAH box helicase, partial [Planctomycetota bacterium]|nr:DEAD/DEAH box helicase [Planctomycetota bacterium]